MPALLLLGKDGQVGSALQRQLAPLGTLTALGRAEADLSQPAALWQCLIKIKPRIIINAAAYTQVDQAQAPENAHTVQAVNAQALRVLGDYAAAHHALVVHYSTDYVFDGTQRRPYTEDDATQPLNVYGASKRAGEMALQQSGCAYLIFRTSWVYAPQGHNFLRTIWRLAQERTQLQVVSDQVGAPTSAALIAQVSALAIQAYRQGTMAAGLYHLSAAGHTSWHGLACYIVQQMQAQGLASTLPLNAIQAISSADYPTAAQRPAYSVLDCRRLEQQLGLRLPPWQEGVAQVLLEGA